MLSPIQKNVALISVYVDDLIITGNACKLIKEIKNQLSHVFEMMDLGELHYCYTQRAYSSMYTMWRKIIFIRRFCSYSRIDKPSEKYCFGYC